MFNASRIRRSAILGALACTLLGAITGGVAAAQPNHDAPTAAALEQERYYSSYGDRERAASDASAQQALQQERYYATYGQPEPLTASATTAPEADRPWLAITLAAVARGDVVHLPGSAAHVDPL